jgi:hypothetical protein
MQIKATQLTCPDCRGALQFFPVLHHMICAYVGPEYDFGQVFDGLLCPKCEHRIGPFDGACEIVSQSAKCPECLIEMPVSPMSASQASPDR